MAKSTFEIIQPRNALREKLGNKSPVLDPAALARAEAALKNLSGQFQQWMEDEVCRVETARDAAVKRNFDPESMNDLYGCAHDAKGMGTTYEYPLITRLAGSLCRLLDTPASRALAVKTPRLLSAHVDAMRAAVRDRIKSDQDGLGAALANELEGQVSKVLAAMPQEA